MTRIYMRRLIAGAVAVVTALAICFGTSSCKGRTMENMEPTGDTVEVIPDTLSAPFAIEKPDSVQ